MGHSPWATDGHLTNQELFYRSSLLWGVTQCNFVVSYRHFETTYPCQLQRSSSLWFFLDCLTLEFKFSQLLRGFHLHYNSTTYLVGYAKLQHVIYPQHNHIDSTAGWTVKKKYKALMQNATKNRVHTLHYLCTSKRYNFRLRQLKNNNIFGINAKRFLAGMKPQKYEG